MLLPMYKLVACLLVWALMGIGCGGPRVIEEAPTPKVSKGFKPVSRGISEADRAFLEEALNSRVVVIDDVITLSNRLLGDGNPAIQDRDTLAKLEILLLRSLQDKSKRYRPIVLRNLGIVNYHQKNYKTARQALQASSELNPRDARSHFYLACIYARQSKIHSAKGEKRKSKAGYKRAQIELEQARKLAPSNPSYRRGLQEVMETD
jgi:tetratricopeptide (TPR) repeat protein